MQEAVRIGPARRPAALPEAARDWLALGGLLVALAALGWSGGALSQALERTPPPASLSAAQLDGAGWEARRLMSAFLWAKTHDVLHAGVEERDLESHDDPSRAVEGHTHGASSPNTRAGGHSHAHPNEGDGRHQEEDGHAHGAEAKVPVIPPRRLDFRGFLGDLERAVKPYQPLDGSGFRKDADQTIPFFRLAARLDPHSIQTYLVGSTFVCRSGKHVDEALAFLREGERRNPRSFEIQTEIGRLLLVYRRDFARADPYFTRAVELVPRDRPLTEAEREEAAELFRWRTLHFREWGRPSLAAANARFGLQIVGEDAVLTRLLGTLRPNPSR